MTDGDADSLRDGPDSPADGPEASGFVEAFMASSERLRRVVAGLGLSPPESDDILQEVFLAALTRPCDYRGPEETARWLTRVTVNRCLMEHRRRKRFRRVTSEMAKSRASTASPAEDDRLVSKEESEAVLEVLKELDASLLVPLVLRYLCDLNSTEIGEILELGPSTVRSRLREARLLLAKRLMGRGIER